MSGKRVRGNGGFWDFVKNPSYRRWLSDRLRRPLPRRMSSSPKAIRSALRRLREGDDPNGKIFARLSALGAVAVPYLVEAVGDPAFDVRCPEGLYLSDSPFEVVLELLEPFGPPEAVGPLTARMSSPDEEVRKLAALALGNIATEACQSPLEAAMTDQDEYVRSYAVIGLRRGITAGRASRALLEGLFDPLAKLLEHPDGFNTSEEAANALLEIDRERAIPILLGESLLGRSNRLTYKIIDVLNEHNITIPTPRLRALLHELRPEALSYPHNYSYGAALMALARSGDSDAEGIIREAMTWEDEKVSRKAAEALGVLAGIGNPYEFAAGRFDEEGFDALTLPQKHYFCVFWLHLEVRNGGFAQYFVNSFGEHAREALEGLEAMGAAHAASVLRRAMDLFGPDGPPTDHEARHAALAGFSDEQDDALGTLTREYYSSGDRIWFLLATYAYAFRSHFKGETAPPLGPGGSA